VYLLVRTRSNSYHPFAREIDEGDTKHIRFPSITIGAPY
ncbi:unnamed protein product, partial [Acidithrix sp. C25]